VKLLCASLLFALPISVGLAEPFQNLNFENSNVPYASNASAIVSAADAFPGWTVRETNTVLTTVPYNAFLSPGANVALNSLGPTGHGALEGLFNAYLNGWYSSDCSIAQFGTVPAGADTLYFRAGGGWSVEALTLTFDGHVLTPVVVEGLPNVAWGALEADVSAFAGLTGELRFTIRDVQAPEGQWLFSNFYLDDIQFVPVPEPHVWALFGLGAIALAAARRHRKRR